MTHWGRAGQRLSEHEVTRRRDERALALRVLQDETDLRHAEKERIARRLYLAGLLVPCRITLALDLRGLEGPAVDAACLAEEPDVDMWEAGVLYPTWEQVQALAKLTGFHVSFFTEPDSRPSVWESSLRFHLPAEAVSELRPPVHRFTAEAVAARFPRPSAHLEEGSMLNAPLISIEELRTDSQLVPMTSHDERRDAASDASGQGCYLAAGLPLAVAYGPEGTPSRLMLSEIALDTLTEAFDDRARRAGTRTWSISSEAGRGGTRVVAHASTGRSWRLRPGADGAYDVAEVPWTWTVVTDRTPVLEAW